MNATELINGVIGQLSDLPAVFSAADVAAYADLSGADSGIERALQTQCDSQSIIALDEVPGSSRRYLGKQPATAWWVASTLRWARAKVNFLTAGQLAREMALAFDVSPWRNAPDGLLAAGRQWAMVADGYAPGTFVFPWSMVVRNNGQFRNVLRLSDDSEERTLESEIDAALSRLTEREADVVRSRHGFDTGQPATLEQIGNRYGVTRERIRQIEQKAYRKLRHPSRNGHFLRAFAADFVQQGGSLIIPESGITPRRKFLIERVGLQTAHIPALALYIIADESDIALYRRTLRNVRSFLEISLEAPCFTAIGALQFLSQHDSILVSNAEQEYRSRHISSTRPYMLREALRTLGRAAHFSEIAEVCNRMFPANQTTTHNWHAALGRRDSEHLGIVWIGIKGTYGLTDHGYSRPRSDLFAAVAEIVAKRFSESHQPVSFDFVLAELGKQRRELNRNSVTMALTFNDKVESVGNNEYAPRESGPSPSSDTRNTEYDIDAAFAAFSASADAQD